MEIKSFFTNSPLRNYNHYIVCERDVIVFDPWDLEYILSDLEGYNIHNYYLMNTHHLHYDHVSRNADFLKIENSKKVELKDKEEFIFGNKSKIQALYTPGHQLDHFCFLIIKENLPVGLISGDTVFNAGVGHCKDNGDPDLLFESIQKIKALDEDIVIYPSHDYFANNLNFAKTIEPNNKTLDEYIERVKINGAFYTSIKEEMDINPFFRTKEIKELDNFKGMTEREVFIKIRELRDLW